MQLAEERDLVVQWSQRLRTDGLVVGTAGNVSIRSGELIAITPSGVDYDKLSAERICVVRRDGTIVEGFTPSIELPLHLALYRAEETRAVVHTHSLYGTAIGTVLSELPAIHYLIALLGGPVPVVPYATPGSAELADSIAATIPGHSALLLRNHGAVTVGRSLPQAHQRAVLLEWLATLYARASALGSPTLVAREELERVEELLAHYGDAAAR